LEGFDRSEKRMRGDETKPSTPTSPTFIRIFHIHSLNTIPYIL
jgi:hypothetical protein